LSDASTSPHPFSPPASAINKTLPSFPKESFRAMGNDWIEHLEAGDQSSSAADATSPLRPPFSLSPPAPAPTSPSSPSSSSVSPPPRFVCTRCRSDLTLLSDIIWEGVMGQPSEPAFLSRRCVNSSLSPPVRRGVQLSTGCYDLVDVECRRCREVLGWKYMGRASSAAERFKVGCTMLAAARLASVDGFDESDEQRRQGQRHPPPQPPPPRRYLFIGRGT
jgi:hypothetical protein